jgi:dihydropteroate synthase
MRLNLDDILNSHLTARAAIVGILNVTPDSFSDGGRFLDPEAARRQAKRMIDEGADVIDIGAESTRPGSDRVSADEQIARLRDVLPAVTAMGAIVSIDTTRSEVAAFALEAGATIINDVSAGRDDGGILSLAASRGVGLVLMHMLGEPKGMQKDPRYRNVVAEVRDFLAARIEAALAAGVRRERIIIDPGIGFGKKLEHNLALLAGIATLCRLGRPVLIGASRKRFIGELTGQSEPAGRVFGSVAASLAAYRRGATLFRMHDVGALASALAIEDAINRSGPKK